MRLRVTAVGRTEVPPLTMPVRFRHEVAYFMTPYGDAGVPKLGADEYWIRKEDAAKYLDEFVVRIVSPLDGANQTEIELSEEQETWLEWMVAHGIEHIRLERD